MRKFCIVLSAAASLALVAGVPAAQAQQSWGPKHTTYWSSDSTGKHEPGKFMQPSVTTIAVQPAAQRRMFYQGPGKRVKAVKVQKRQAMRLRQQQPAQPGKPPMDPGAQPPAERSAQPPADAKPSAPPTQGRQPPAQGTPK